MANVTINSNGSNPSLHWWKAEGDDVHQQSFGLVQYLSDQQQARNQSWLLYAQLYANSPVGGLTPDMFSKVSELPGFGSRVTFNVIASMVDTVVNKIGKNRPRPRFLTSGGTWEMQELGKKLDKFQLGQFYDCDAYSVAKDVFKDACVFGTGLMKVFKEDDRIRVERSIPSEVFVDSAESFSSAPRQMHQRKFIDRDQLVGMFPEKKALIEEASTGGAMMDDAGFRPTFGLTTTNMVPVVESWHLPSGKDACDGRHVICTSNATLFDEEWTQDRFPFAIIRWKKNLAGFWGIGLAEDLYGIQIEINKLMAMVQRAMHLVSVPKIFVAAGSKVVETHLDNSVAGIIEYSGDRAPTGGPLAQVPPDLFRQIETLFEKAYQLSGVSELSAQAKKPTGVDSGKALREFSDIESERFLTVGQDYEALFIDIAKQMVRLAKEVFEDTGHYRVHVKGEKFLDTIDWADVDLEEDEFQLQMYPVSMLSNTPAGRLQDVSDLQGMGYLSREEAIKLLGFPDIEGFNSLETAPLDDIEHTISRIVSHGDFQTPEPLQNLQLGVKKFTQAYLHYKNVGLPEHRLDMLRQWIEIAGTMLAQGQAQAAPPPPPGPPGMAAPAGPQDLQAPSPVNGALGPMATPS